MTWRPIETIPQNVNVLVCGKDFYGERVVTGAIFGPYGWSPVGVGGYECDFEVTPEYWSPAPALPNAPVVGGSIEPASSDRLSWDPSPYTFGLIHARMNGRTASVGGIAITGKGIRGYLLSKLVYESHTDTDETAAQAAVQREFDALPEWVRAGFRD